MNILNKKFKKKYMRSLPHDNLPILFLQGDGVGEDLLKRVPGFIQAMLLVYNGKNGTQLSISTKVAPFGTSALLSHGKQIPYETLALLNDYNLVIKGPSRTPNMSDTNEIDSIWQKWYSHLTREACVAEVAKLTSANVGLRQMLNLYACKRPVMHYPGVPSNFKKTGDIDFIVFRENTEGFYGMPNMTSAESAELVKLMLQSEILAKHAEKLAKNDDFIIAFGQCSKIATKRIMRAAMEQAIKEGRKIVTIAHKGNIMKGFFGAFVKWCLEVVTEEYADKAIISKWKVNKQYAYSQDKIIVDDIIIDNCCEKTITNPGIYDIIVMENLMGDIYTDLAAGLVGGLGVAPGTNINYETGKAVYEAVHGTADDIAGKDLVNPTSYLLSLFMLFEDQGGEWTSFSKYCKNAIGRTFMKGEMTGDLARQLSNDHPKLSFSEFLAAIIESA